MDKWIEELKHEDRTHEGNLENDDLLLYYTHGIDEIIIGGENLDLDKLKSLVAHMEKYNA